MTTDKDFPLPETFLEQANSFPDEKPILPKSPENTKKSAFLEQKLTKQNIRLTRAGEEDSIFKPLVTAALIIDTLATVPIPLKKAIEGIWKGFTAALPGAKVFGFFAEIAFESNESLNFQVKDKRGNVEYGKDGKPLEYSETALVKKYIKDATDKTLNKLEKKGKINEGVHKEFLDAIKYSSGQLGGKLISQNMPSSTPKILHQSHAANLGNKIGREVEWLIKNNGISKNGIIKGVELHIPMVDDNGKVLLENEDSIVNKIIGKGDVTYKTIKVDIDITDKSDIVKLANSKFIGEYYIKSPEQKALAMERSVVFPGTVSKEEAEKLSNKIKTFFEKADMTVDDFNKFFQLKGEQTINIYSHTIKNKDRSGDAIKIADYIATKSPEFAARIELIIALNENCKTDPTLDGTKLASLAGVAGENKQINSKLEVITHDDGGNIETIESLTPTEVKDLLKAMKKIAAEHGIAKEGDTYPIDKDGNIIPIHANDQEHTLEEIVGGKSTEELRKMINTMRESLKQEPSTGSDNSVPPSPIHSHTKGRGGRGGRGVH